MNLFEVERIDGSVPTAQPRLEITWDLRFGAARVAGEPEIRGCFCPALLINMHKVYCVNETTYNLVVHAATIAREQNAQDMDKARDQFKAVLKTIEPPMKEKIYSIPDLAMSYGAAAFNSANQWLTRHKDEFPIKEFSFNNHLGGFMTYSEFQLMLGWMRERYIYTPQRKVEKPKQDKLAKTLAEPKPRISEERITISVHGLALTVGKAEALKIAQSIMNQIGG